MSDDTWVALLRGVNVGGVTVRSAELAAAFRSLGLSDVRTVLATGNVVFREEGAASARSSLVSRIEACLSETFRYDAHVILVSADDVLTAIAQFPFDAADDSRQPYVIFCSDATTCDELVQEAQSMDAATDPVAAGPGVVYWHAPKGRSTETPFAKLIAKARYRATTTNRNLRTLHKIVG
jgi:uncharacterized protein (DUF1697 family)